MCSSPTSSPSIVWRNRRLSVQAICVFIKKRTPEIVWHFTERTPEQQVEYLDRHGIVAQQITGLVFYKRVGFWCRQCEFLPVCTGNDRKAKQALMRLPEAKAEMAEVKR